MSARARRVEYGDFQTPLGLARDVCAWLARGPLAGRPPASVLEPTCGDGAFLAAAAQQWPAAGRIGLDIDRAHLARAAVADAEARLIEADAFTTDWAALLAELPRPVLVLGNPPWVTSAAVGALGGANRPRRDRPSGLSGLDALTGKSNFDVSEWITLRLLAALSPGDPLALLLKSATARRVLAHHWRHGPPPAAAALLGIDARAHFGAAVDAGLLFTRLGASADEAADCAVHAALDRPRTHDFGLRDGDLVADTAAYARARPALGVGPRWRSGIKHDAARVLELRAGSDGWRNGLGEAVDVEPEALFPLMKSADVAHGRRPSRWLLVPHPGPSASPTEHLAAMPRARAYLDAHGARLDRRRSAIYRKRPRFSIFGVGPYSFTRWKVAISGMYAPRFTLVGPHQGRPVVFDDTVYLLPCPDEAVARAALAALESPAARDALAALVFPDAKRPVTASLLGRLDLAALGGPEALGAG